MFSRKRTLVVDYPLAGDALKFKRVMQAACDEMQLKCEFEHRGSTGVMVVSGRADRVQAFADYLRIWEHREARR